jgi:hypothetical protein
MLYRRLRDPLPFLRLSNKEDVMMEPNATPLEFSFVALLKYVNAFVGGGRCDGEVSRGARGWLWLWSGVPTLRHGCGIAWLRREEDSEEENLWGLLTLFDLFHKIAGEVEPKIGPFDDVRS